MKKIFKRLIVILPAVLVELLVIYLIYTWFNPWARQIQSGFRFLSFLLVLYLVSYRQEGAYRVLWLLLFSILPIPAAVAYVLWGNKRTVRPITDRVKNGEAYIPKQVLWRNGSLRTDLRQNENQLHNGLLYVNQLCGAPLCSLEGAIYYPDGESCWQAMLSEMKKAEKYIYLEYFIVEDGLMWGSMREILEEKAASGVDVRFIYDDFGSVSTFSKEEEARLRGKGISVVAFNEIKFIGGTLNNRSHRKMLIIDGRIAFSGGINLADEYINHIERFGYWKDIGFSVTGECVKNFVYLFACFWNGYSPDAIPLERFGISMEEWCKTDNLESPSLLPVNDLKDKNGKGLVMTYSDSPGARDPISYNFYIELLENAKEYAWFYTPYLMPGDSLLDAFVRTAKRGVDVRIIMPGVPDKKMVFRISRSYYRTLMDAGVKIYQYSPGFVHAKAALSDDEICTIGSVNLDYRSLYLHFENNSIFWKSQILFDLKEDYLKTLKDCEKMGEKDLRRGIPGTLLDGILRIFAPLC